MSAFSEQLKHYILRRGMTIRQLSIQTEIEYSFLYRITAGKRNPSSLNMVNLLIRTLALSKHEADALREAYEIARVGEGTYQRRMAVRQMLVSAGQPPASALALYSSVHMERIPEVCTGRGQVHTLVKALLDQECSQSGGRLRIVAQPTDAFFMELLQVQAAHNPDLQITQIVCFPNRPEDESHNITLFGALLPLLLSLPNYSAHYYYGAARSIAGKMALFPVLFLTSACGVLLTADGTSALCFPAGSKAYAALERRFAACLEGCPPLMHAVNGLPAYLDEVQTMFSDTVNDNETSIVLTPDICYVPFLTEEICRRAMTRALPNREHLLRRIMEQVAVSRALCSKETTRHLTTLAGVRRFLDTGRLMDLPCGLYEPLTMKERCYLLHAFLDAVRTIPQYQLALYDPDQLPFSPTLECTVQQNSTHTLFVTPRSQTSVSSIDIQEPIISSAIYDYFSSLFESPAVSSEEESLVRLYALLDEYEDA